MLQALRNESTEAALNVKRLAVKCLYRVVNVGGGGYNFLQFTFRLLSEKVAYFTLTLVEAHPRLPTWYCSSWWVGAWVFRIELINFLKYVWTIVQTIRHLCLWCYRLPNVFAMTTADGWPRFATLLRPPPPVFWRTLMSAMISPSMLLWLSYRVKKRDHLGEISSIVINSNQSFWLRS